jgi:phage-related protein
MIERSIKPVRWIGTSLRDLRAIAADAQDEIGHQLWRVQTGLRPDDFKPMTIIGSGVFEIRAHTRLEHRAIYVAKFEEAVYVLHVIEKKTRKTPKRDNEISRRRFEAVQQSRQALGS